MPRAFWTTLAIAMFLNLTAYGQSLGDIARETREKQIADDASGAKPKLITNKDLPPDAQANPVLPEPPSSTASERAEDRRFAQQHRAEQRESQQWKRQISAQANRVTNLRGQIDQISASLHAAGGTAQYEGPYSRSEARQLYRIAQLQQQLDEQQRKLDAMQEAARHAGMHTPVYDP